MTNQHFRVRTHKHKKQDMVASTYKKDTRRKDSGDHQAPVRLVAIGEVMAELSDMQERPRQAVSLRGHFGGDVFNTAVYLARILLGKGLSDNTAPKNYSVSLASRIGEDPFSLKLRAFLQETGIDESCLVTEPGGRTGLYLIEIDERGERRFHYWRGQSPARSMFQKNIAPETNHLADFDVYYISAISLAIWSPSARTHILSFLDRRRQDGALVVFDTNYRPALWEDQEIARTVIEQAMRVCSLLLPSHEDLMKIYATEDEPEKLIKNMRQMTKADIVLKTGGGAIYSDSENIPLTFTPDHIPQPVDTTGAGDSFNAALIAARVMGKSLTEQLEAGHHLATQVIMHPGAIMAP